MLGQKIKNYNIIKRSSKNDIYTIYVARDSAKNRDVIIQVYTPSKSHQQNQVDSIKDELQKLQNVDSKNVSKIFDVFLWKSRICLVKEYAEGLSLDKILHMNGKFTLEASVEIAIQVLQGLIDLRSILGNQEKLSLTNLMMTDRGEVKIMNPENRIHNQLEKLAFEKANNNILCISSLSTKKPNRSHHVDLHALGLILQKMTSAAHKGSLSAEGTISYSVFRVRKLHIENALRDSFQNIILNLLNCEAVYKEDSFENVLIQLENLQYKIAYENYQPKLFATKPFQGLANNVRERKNFTTLSERLFKLGISLYTLASSKVFLASLGQASKKRRAIKNERVSTKL